MDLNVEDDMRKMLSKQLRQKIVSRSQSARDGEAQVWENRGIRSGGFGTCEKGRPRQGRKRIGWLSSTVQQKLAEQG